MPSFSSSRAVLPSPGSASGSIARNPVVRSIQVCVTPTIQNLDARTAEVLKTLLCECVASPLHPDRYSKFRTRHHRFLLRYIGFRRKKSTRTASTEAPLPRIRARDTETPPPHPHLHSTPRTHGSQQQLTRTYYVGDRRQVGLRRGAGKADDGLAGGLRRGSSRFSDSLGDRTTVARNASILA